MQFNLDNILFEFVLMKAITSPKLQDACCLLQAQGGHFNAHDLFRKKVNTIKK